MTKYYVARQSKAKWICTGAFVFIFVGLYIFFRYVHPVVPWDGDDWATLTSKIVMAKTPWPVIGNFESERMFCSFLGTIFGYFAAFVIYPILGDYVLSIIITNAFALALTITVSLIGIYHLLKRVSQGNSLCTAFGIGLFLLFSFVVFKTKEGSCYLYWQYNLCTIYFYSLPSYLAGTFGIYLIINEVYHKSKWQLNYRTSVLLGIWYLLNFSFLPAALLLAAVSVIILLLRYVERKSLRCLYATDWFYWMILIGSAIKMFFEMIKNFESGYLKIEGDLFQKVRDSFLCLIMILKEMHPLFYLTAGFFILTAIWIKMKKHATEDCGDKRATKVFAILIGAFVLLFAFFILFGAISINHIYRGIPRLDTLYVLFFLMLLIVVLCMIYVLENSQKMIVIVPLLMLFMFFVMISPRNNFSDSIYTDTTPMQRCEIMRDIIKEAQRRDLDGEPGFIVHMPKINHYSF